MPSHNTVFHNAWLSSVDRNGHVLSLWCEKKENNKEEVYCRLCMKFIKYNNQGLLQILQHAVGKKHKKLSHELLGGNQQTLKLVNEVPMSNAVSLSDSGTGTGKLFCVSNKDKATAAEIYWALKVVMSNYSFSSCDGIKELFEGMFGDRDGMPPQFTMSSRKVSYLITEGLGPYFHNKIVKDVKKAMTPYTVHFDETTNKQISKQLDLRIRYWSASSQQIEVSHLDTVFMGKACGDQVANKIITSLQSNGLPLSDLLMLGSDGPNVNKTVFRLVNEEVIKTRGPGNKGLLEIGTCNLHIVHNSFGKALNSKFSTTNIPELIIDIYTWFKLSAARREAFRDLQLKLNLPSHSFLKHVECRWLSLLPAICRILDQQNAIIQYFIKDLPKSRSFVVGTARYKRIRNVLSKPEIFMDLHFIKSIAELYHGFLLNFQTQEPMIHLLYESLLALTKQLLGRFIKQDNISKRVSDLVKLDITKQDMQLDDKTIETGDKCQLLMKGLSPESRRQFILRVRTFYEVAAKHLLDKLPLTSSVLRFCRVLKPSIRQEAWTLRAIKELAMLLQVDVDSAVLGDEWKVYQLEKISTDIPKGTRVDRFWKKVFDLKNINGDQKYPMLTKTIKVALVLSHGSADVERAFSESNHVVTSERVKLSPKTINAILAIKSGTKVYEKAHCVPITQELVNMARLSHSAYVQRLEQERVEKEKEEERKREMELQEEERKDKLEKMKRNDEDISSKEKKISDQEEQLVQEIHIGNELLKDGNDKLKEAIKSKDMNKASLAHCIIETAGEKIRTAEAQREELRGQKRKLEKRKQSLIDDFLSCSQKKRKN